MSRWRVGVDSGGTFTDVCLFDEQAGRVEVWKVPSTPDDPSRGIAEGVEEGCAAARSAPAVRRRRSVYFGHGTTVATNALIQHRGVKTGLITTDGFRDLLEIGRQKRPDLYDIQADKPRDLVPRDLRLEVPERVHHTGEIETPLDEAAMRAAARAPAAAGVRRSPSASSTASSGPSTSSAPSHPGARRSPTPSSGSARDRARVPRVRAACRPRW